MKTLTDINTKTSFIDTYIVNAWVITIWTNGNFFVDFHGSRLGYQSIYSGQTVSMIKYLLYKTSSKFTFVKAKKLCTLPLSICIEVEHYRNHCELWFTAEIFLTYSKRKFKWLFVYFFYFKHHLFNALKLSGFSFLHSLVL